MGNSFPQTERASSAPAGKTPLCTDLQVSSNPRDIKDAIKHLASEGLDPVKLDLPLRTAYSVATLHTDPEDTIFAYWFFAVPDPHASAVPILSATKIGGNWTIDRFNPGTYTR